MPKRKNKNFLFSGKSKLKLKKSLSRRISHFPTHTILFSLGIFFISLWLIYSFLNASRLSFSSEITPSPIVIGTETPSTISIPSVNITLPVHQTTIKNGIWEIDENGVSHLANSGNPGSKSNNIYYGHNTDNRLSRLTQVKKGDRIIINNKYTYVVSEIIVVKPYELEKLYAHSGETLTIYTCSGFADLERLLVKAKRVVS